MCRAPFTIQRICELLAYPQKHFLTLDKLLNGLDKVRPATSPHAAILAYQYASR
ncbi:hypothetical protein EON66_09805 [archaeon]|nr:MAG: hypothetical protein EON66_09805 [archaeon]